MSDRRDQSSRDAAEVLAAWSAQLDAMDAGDTEALRGCLTQDMTLRHMTGFVQPVSQWLAGIRRREFVYHRLEERSVELIELTTVTARLVGHVVTGVTDDGSGHAWPLRLEQEYVLTDKGWRCRTSNVSLD